MELLLKAGCDPNAVISAQGMCCPLTMLCAITAPGADIISLLVEYEADFNIASDLGQVSNTVWVHS